MWEQMWRQRGGLYRLFIRVEREELAEQRLDLLLRVPARVDLHLVLRPEVRLHLLQLDRHVLKPHAKRLQAVFCRERSM